MCSYKLQGSAHAGSENWDVFNILSVPELGFVNGMK